MASSVTDANLPDKAAIRKQILDRRQGLSSGETAARSEKIFRNFVEHAGEILPAGFSSVALYYPIRGEVDTRAFFRHFSALRKRCLFPRVDKASTESKMAFYEVRDLAALQLGAFGIAEPRPLPGATPVQPDIVLVPGVAFSEHLHRLGYGAGYYDRACAGWHASGHRPAIRLVGLAFDFQLVPSIPNESHDESMDFVVSEERVLKRGAA